MTFTWVITQDGSGSCLDSETGELCHNRAGAYTEALKNYAEPSGLLGRARDTGDIRILDACYGLGYNTWVFIDYLLKKVAEPFTISVTAIEKDPGILALAPRIFEDRTFDPLKNLLGPLEHNIDYRTQSCSIDTKVGSEEGGYFVINVADRCRIRFRLMVSDLRECLPQLQDDFDAVFHDPFSPQKMPELWTVDLFRHYQRFLRARDGRVLTYSAAGAVRGGLQEAGFQIGKTPGLGDKQGGTIASLAGLEGSPLAPEETAYLQTRAGLPYRDPGLTLSRQDIIKNRILEQQHSLLPSGSSVRKPAKR